MTERELLRACRANRFNSVQTAAILLNFRQTQSLLDFLQGQSNHYESFVQGRTKLIAMPDPLNPATWQWTAV